MIRRQRWIVLRRVIPGILVFWVAWMGFTTANRGWASDSNIVQTQGFEGLRVRQAEAKRKALQEKAGIEAHLREVEAFRGGLTLPQQQKSYDKASSAIQNDQKALRLIDMRLQRLEQTMRTRPAGAAVRIHGDVQIMTAQGWRPMDGTESIQPGETVSTGPGGSVDVVFEDGTLVRMEPNSEFRLAEKTPRETVYELLKGEIDVIHAVKAIQRYESEREWRRILYRTRAVIAAVRGTEFRLSLDQQDLTHLKLASGAVDLSAREGAIHPSALKRWWNEPGSSETPPTDNAVQIRGVKGSVMIQSEGRPAKPAKAGDPLPDNQTLVTGPGSLAEISLPEGYRLLMGADSRLKPGKDPSTSLSVYEILHGSFYAAGHARDPRHLPQFKTPTTVAGVRGTAFEVTVDDKGGSDWIPLEGTLGLDSHEHK